MSLIHMALNPQAFYAGSGTQPRKKANDIVATCSEQRQKIRLELLGY